MNRREFLSELAELIPMMNYDFNSRNFFDRYDDKVVISLAGDVTLGYRFNNMFKSFEELYGEEKAFQAPFENVSDIFRKSDISIINLEGTLTKSNKVRPKEFNFKGDPKFARCLNEGYIDIVNIANNHIMDFYEPGILDTISVLNDLKILYCGAGKNLEDASTPRFIEKKGIVFGFLGCALVGSDYPAQNNSAGTNAYNSEKITVQIKETKNYSDITVVSCHWGIERNSFPEVTQRNFAHTMINSGADIVFGHHPHVIQGIEKYNSGVIFYSLGNFVFGGNTFPSDRDSFIASVRCSKSKVEGFEVIPVITHPKPLVFQPYVPEQYLKIMEKISNRSKFSVS